MPDATGLELIAHELRELEPESILDTEFHRGRAALIAEPSRIRPFSSSCTTRATRSSPSLHGVDYYPDEPRLGVLYELMDMNASTGSRSRRACTRRLRGSRRSSTCFPGADFPEREVYDMFGVVFDGHPDMRRILMPEDYEGFPQRRDFPVGGEPVLFTYNEETGYGK